MMPARTLASMASWPRVGPTVLRERTSTGTGSAPPLMRTASSSASAWVKLPVICVEPPWMPMPHCTLGSTCGEEITWPSSTIATRRRGSSGWLQAAAAVSASQSRPPLPWNSTETKRWVPVVSRPTLASPTPSPVRAAGPTRIGWPSSSSRTFSWLVSTSCGSTCSTGADGVALALGVGVAGPAGALGSTCVARAGGTARPAVVALGAGTAEETAEGTAEGAADGAPDGDRPGGTDGAALGASGRSSGCRPTMRLGSPGPSTGWKVSWAVWPMASAASAAFWTPGSSTMIRLAPERASVGSATPSASTRRRSTSSARSVASASASVVGLSWVSRTICVPPRRSRPRRGSCVTA